MNAAPEPIAYRIKDAVAASGLGKTKLYELIADGEIKSFKVGTRTLIPRSEIEAYFKRLQAAADPAHTPAPKRGKAA